MSRFPNIFLLVVFVCMHMQPLFAQKYDFQNFSTENGLPQAQILCINQDSNGKIWLGTNDGGIAVFDGTKFNYYSTDHGLLDNVVFDIEFLNGETLLVADNTGLSKVTFGVNNCRVDTSYTSLGRVFDIEKVSENEWLLGTTYGVYSFDGKGVHRKQISDKVDSFPVVNISTYENEIWYSTLGNGALRQSVGKLDHISTENGLYRNYVYSVLKANQTDYLISTYKGIFKTSAKNILSLSSFHEDEFSESFQTHFYGAYSIDKDFWFATSNGVYKYNKKLERITTSNGLINNNIWRVFEDREGNLWMGSKENGLSVLKGLDWVEFATNSKTGEYDIVNHVCRSSTGILMLSCRNGFSLLYNGSTVNYDFENGLASGSALCSVEANDGVMWIGTNSGISMLKDGKMKSFEFDKATQNGYNRCYDVIKDREGAIWFATHGGLAKLVNERPVVYEDVESQPKIIFDLFQSNDGSMWLGCESGLYLRTSEGYRLMSDKDGIPAKRINTIAEDKKGVMWVATNEGIYYYKDDKFHAFTIANGLSSNNVYSMGFELDGTLWLGLPNGVDRLKIDKDFNIVAIKHFDSDNGFLGKECTDNSIWVDDESGEIYFGTINGLMVYRKKFERTSGRAPEMILEKVKLFNEETNWSVFADSVTNNGLPYKPELSFRENYFSFHFIGINQRSPKKVIYQYKLEGFDKEWSTNTNKTEAIYSNLPAGKYKFVVKAANENMVWSEPVTFSFRILPPFYQTWWFYTLCIAIVVAGIFSYIKIRSANIKIVKQNKIIEEKNTDLELAYTEIAQTNKNITDSIKYAKRLQDAILPAESRVKELLGNAFVYYNPKDIVSGDFYWLVEKENKIFISAIDCTGHGVPGALVSIVGNNGLMRAVNEFGLRTPGAILDKLCVLVEETLRQNNESEVKDGMDMALCSIDRSDMILEYAGANNPLYIVRALGEEPLLSNGNVVEPKLKSNSHCLYELKASKQPIGSYDKRISFTNHTIQVKQGDHIYMSSDGYADQFGGLKGKKFLYKSLRELLLSLAELGMQEQKGKLVSRFEAWKAGYEQVDDVCVVGFTV